MSCNLGKFIYTRLILIKMEPVWRLQIFADASNYSCETSTEKEIRLRLVRHNKRFWLISASDSERLLGRQGHTSFDCHRLEAIAIHAIHFLLVNYLPS
jgi:hypothetical protein